MRVGLLHGPNLGRLGRREPEIYGSSTLTDVNQEVATLGGELGLAVEPFQSNHEGELVDWIESVSDQVQGFLVNPGGLTHTSVVLRDALVGTGHPFVEVHISNPAARESFRRHSYLSDAAAGVVYGFGVQSYLLGLRGLAARLQGT